MEKNSSELTLQLPCFPNVNNAYTVQINAAPYTSAIEGNEQASDIFELIWLVYDGATETLVDTIRQGDRRLTKHTVHVPSTVVRSRQVIDLSFRPTMPWRSGNDPQISLIDHSINLLPPHITRIDVQYGCPNDLPFFGENWSYGEGADARGTWFHCKRFRWANNQFEMFHPALPHSRQFVQLNAHTGVAFRIDQDNGAADAYLPTRGARWHQDDYRLAIRDTSTSSHGGIPLTRLVVSAVSPMPGLQADLRELFMGVESLESAAYSTREVRLRVSDALNAGLAGGTATGSDEISAVSFNLLRHVGTAGCGDVPFAAPPDGQPMVDCMVFVDSFHDQLAAKRLETGAVWLNSTVGAALSLINLGLAVRYGGLAEIERLNPRVVIVPFQHALRDLTPEALNILRGRDRILLFEAGFSPALLEDGPISTRFGWKLSGEGRFVPRDDWQFADGTKFPELWKAFVHFFSPGSRHVDVITAAGHRWPVCVQSAVDRNAFLITGGFFFNYYNYGLHTQTDVLAKLLFEVAGFQPTVRSSSRSRVLYEVHEGDSEWVIHGYNCNAGLFPYHGIGRAFSVHQGKSRPPIGRVTFDIKASHEKPLTVREASDATVNVAKEAGHYQVTVDGARDGFRVRMTSPTTAVRT
jgi:hypothetical protein